MTKQAKPLVFVITLLFIITSVTIAQVTPRDIAMRVADRIVAETQFRFDSGLPPAVQEGFYHIDFIDGLGPQDGAYLARAVLHVDSSLSQKDRSELALGLSYSSGMLEVTIGGEIRYSGSGNLNALQHLDYSLIRPAVRVPLEVDAGSHEMRIRFDPDGPEAHLWLGFVRLDNELSAEGVEIVLPDGLEAGDASRFVMQGEIGEWIIPRVHLVSKLPHRLAYSDWRYFTGTFLDAMYTVSDTFDDLDYAPFVQLHMDNFRRRYPVIWIERKMRGLIESPFGHYFRFKLLDDMGMQTVPFAEHLRRNPEGEQSQADREIVDRSIDHIMHRAARLADGTWARLNPDSLTVWADDLFMGSVLLSRMAVIDGQRGYLDEAAKQVIQMHRYLNDPSSNLYWHGYFARAGEHSSSKWGRANGWTMMAKTELLSVLPEDHPSRAEVLKAFQDHAAGLLAVQAEDGRWHQVLDNPDTYLETSCTAMFTRAFAEGVRRGWLPEQEYRPAADRGWAAVARQVRADGMVEGIVRGTPIFYSDQEYEDHPTRLNDPRGLGAVLYAASSMELLHRSEP